MARDSGYRRIRRLTGLAECNEVKMPKLSRIFLVLAVLSLLLARSSYSQNSNISSLTAISPAADSVPVSIFSIGRRTGVVTICTMDPTNADRYAQQSNRI